MNNGECDYGLQTSTEFDRWTCSVRYEILKKKTGSCICVALPKTH